MRALLLSGGAALREDQSAPGRSPRRHCDLGHSPQVRPLTAHPAAATYHWGESRKVAAYPPLGTTERTMSNDPNREVKLTLTEEQKKIVKEESGHEASAITFTVEELESRVTPRLVGPDIAM